MHAESSIIESIRTFFLTCPFLHDGRVNVDYLGEEMSYSIDPLPCDPVIQKYVDGGKRNSTSLRSVPRKSMTRMPG